MDCSGMQLVAVELELPYISAYKVDYKQVETTFIITVHS